MRITRVGEIRKNLLGHVICSLFIMSPLSTSPSFSPSLSLYALYIGGSRIRSTSDDAIDIDARLGSIKIGSAEQFYACAVGLSRVDL